jgi:hypothetical protein
MEQITTAGTTLVSLLFGGAISFFLQRKERQEKLILSEVDCHLYTPVEISEETAREHSLSARAGLGVDLAVDLINRGSHPSTVRRWSWFAPDEESRKVSWPVCSEVRLAKLDEWEFDPPKELTEGVLGIPFVIGAGEVAVLTFGGMFPGVSYVVLDVGTSKLCVKYWGSEREYEWRAGEG